MRELRPALIAALTVAGLLFACSSYEPAGRPSNGQVAAAPKDFIFETYDETTIRENPTTQIAIQVAQWPNQTFLLWLPEWVGELWQQWDPAVGHQEFRSTESGGLRWEFGGNPKAEIAAELTPRSNSLLLEVSVKNLSAADLKEVRAQNCLHLSKAPDFASRDFTRLYIRSGGHWRSLAELNPTTQLPMYYRPGFLESGRKDTWDGGFRSNNQVERADHPLMICTSKDGRRAIATASEDYQCLFHNQQIDYLLCIHSQQASIESLAAGEQAAFRQIVYFIDGGIVESIEAFERDVRDGVFRARYRTPLGPQDSPLAEGPRGLFTNR